MLEMLAEMRDSADQCGTTPPPKELARRLNCTRPWIRKLARDAILCGYLRQPFPRWAYVVTARGLDALEELEELEGRNP